MRLFSKLRLITTKQAPIALRNKPGGMAWVSRPPFINAATKCPATIGQDEIVGAAVKCIVVDANRCWKIEPILRFNVTEDFIYTNLAGEKCQARAGQTAIVSAIHDDCLTPWRDDGVTEEEVRELYHPALDVITLSVTFDYEKYQP